MRRPMTGKEEYAFEKWPFLAELKLPDDMWWKAYHGEPCIGTKRDAFAGWVTMRGVNQEQSVVSWKNTTNFVPTDTSLEDACRALSVYAWTIGEDDERVF